MMVLGLVLVAALAAWLVAHVVDGAEALSATELYAKKKECVEKASAIDAKAKAEKRSPTSDEAKEMDALLDDAAKYDTLASTVATGEARAQRLAAARESLSKPMPRPQYQATTTSTANAGEAEVAVTSGFHNRAEDDKARGFRSYDDFAMMVKESSRAGVISGEWSRRPEIMAAPYGQNTMSGEDGGFLIPVEFSNKIIERAFGGSLLRAALLGKMDKLSLRGNSITVVGMTDHDRSSTTYRYGGVIPYWVDEAGQITRSSLKFRRIELKLHKMGALSFVTDEEMADAGYNFGARLMEKHGDAMGDELIEQVLWGLGAGKPLGMLADANASVIETAKEGGQLADTLCTENVLNMEADLWTDSEPNALWIYNRECRKPLRLLKYDIGTAGALMSIFERRGKGDTTDLLDGIPAYASDHAPKLGDEGDLSIVDPTQYLFASKGSPESAMSIHLRFDYGEVAWRTFWRCDGRPAWETELTPRKGATAKRESPFVKLAERA